MAIKLELAITPKAIPSAVEIVSPRHEVGVLDVVGGREEARGVDHAAGAEQDAVAVDDEDAAVGGQRAHDLRRPEAADHAVERDRRAARLIEAHALVGADVERVPVDDSAVGRLVDDHRRAALALDGGGSADHRRPFGSGRYRRDPKRQQGRGGEQHAAHVRQACHVIAKRLVGWRIARGAGVAEDFCRSCPSSNEIVAQ